MIGSFASAVLLALIVGALPAAAQEVDDPAAVSDSLPADVSTAPDVSSAPDVPPPADVAAPADVSVGATSGLIGHVVASQRCPVPIGGGGPVCPDRPFATSVRVRTADGQQQVALVPTDPDGAFSIPLAPGSYLVDAMLADGRAPASDPIAVTVPESVTIRVAGGAVRRVP